MRFVRKKGYRILQRRKDGKIIRRITTDEELQTVEGVRLSSLHAAGSPVAATAHLYPSSDIEEAGVMPMKTTGLHRYSFQPKEGPELRDCRIVEDVAALNISTPITRSTLNISAHISTVEGVCLPKLHAACSRLTTTGHIYSSSDIEDVDVSSKETTILYRRSFQQKGGAEVTVCRIAEDAAGFNLSTPSNVRYGSNAAEIHTVGGVGLPSLHVAGPRSTTTSHMYASSDMEAVDLRSRKRTGLHRWSSQPMEGAELKACRIVVDVAALNLSTPRNLHYGSNVVSSAVGYVTQEQSSRVNVQPDEVSTDQLTPPCGRFNRKRDSVAGFNDGDAGNVATCRNSAVRTPVLLSKRNLREPQAKTSRHRRLHDQASSLEASCGSTHEKGSGGTFTPSSQQSLHLTPNQHMGLSTVYASSDIEDVDVSSKETIRLYRRSFQQKGGAEVTVCRIAEDAAGFNLSTPSNVRYGSNAAEIHTVGGAGLPSRHVAGPRSTTTSHMYASSDMEVVDLRSRKRTGLHRWSSQPMEGAELKACRIVVDVAALNLSTPRNLHYGSNVVSSAVGHVTQEQSPRVNVQPDEFSIDQSTPPCGRFNRKRDSVGGFNDGDAGNVAACRNSAVRTPVLLSKRNLREPQAKTSRRRRLHDHASSLEASCGSTHEKGSGGTFTPSSQQSPHLTPNQHMGLSTVFDPAVAISYKYTNDFYRRRKRRSVVDPSRRKNDYNRGVYYPRKRDVILEKKKERYQCSPEFLRRVSLAAKQRYLLSPRYRFEKNKKARSLYSDPLNHSELVAVRRQRDRQRYAINPTDRERRKKRSAVATLQRYHECSPYRRTTIQRTGLSIKRKYHRIRLFRRSSIGNASDRYKDFMKSCSKKRVLRLNQRNLYQDSCGKRKARRRILYNNKKRKSKRVKQIVKHQSTSKRYKVKKRIRDKNRNDCAAGRCLRQRKSLALLMLSRRKRLLKRPSGLNPPMVKKGTLEYRRLSFARWKRYKVNYLLSTVVGLHEKSGNLDRASDQYGQLKLKVTHLLDQILVWQRQQRSVLYQVVFKLHRQFSEAESLIANVDDDAESVAILEDFYGGRRYHVSTQEAYIHAKADFAYQLLSSLGDVDAPSFSRSVATEKGTLARECGDDCELDIIYRWSVMLHSKMKLLDANLLIRTLLINVYEFQRCEKCMMEHELCTIMDQCSDMMRCIYILKPHYVRLRTLTNTLLQMHAAAFELHLLELLLKGGTYEHCQEFKANRFPDEFVKFSEDGERGEEHTELRQCSDKYVMEKYGSLFTDFMDQLKSIMPIYECCSCLKLIGKVRLKRYESDSKFLKRFEVEMMLKDYENHFGRKAPSPVTICNACDALLKQRKSSLYCCANAMWPVPVPSELACLNTYEQQLIAICKCYMKIIRLQPYRYRGLATATFAKGVRGLAVHLPLPSGTLKKACDILEDDFTLPDYSKFMIEVDGLPNVPRKLLFRSLVDISAVMTALRWLKSHNHLYKKATIDESFLQLNDDHLPLILQNKQPSVLMEEVDAVPSVVDADEPEESTVDQQESALLVSGSANVHDERITDVIARVLVETEADSAVEGVLEQRRVKKKAPSFIDARNDEAVNAANDDVIGGTIVGSAVGDVHCENVVAGAAIGKAVSECNFPIPYAVPYKRILLDQLKDKSSMLMQVPGHDILENYSVVELEPSMPKCLDLQLFAMKPVEGDPLRSDDPNLDVACFPRLFPDGKNGLCYARRTVSPAYYYQHRFEMSDRRFCRDQSYLLDTALRKDIASIQGGIYTMLNTGRFGKLTVGQLKKGIKNPEQSEKLERNVLSLLGSVVGSVPYWIRVRRDLEAMVEELGAATYFLTLSCAEYKNEDFKVFFEFRNWDLPNVRNIDARNLASLDPVSVSVHFHNRFTALWEKVIMDKDGPLGTVENFYIKKEYQQRGAPHMHIMLWVAGAPIYGKASDDEVLEFIQKHLCCTLPDPLESPVLHKLVMSCQMHKCTKSCLRVISFRGQRYSTVCRYGFPRKVMPVGCMNSTEDVLRTRANGKRKIKLYHLRRTKDEQLVNDYNAALLYMWGANMDLQYIGEVSMSLTYYTSIYATKYEKQNFQQATQNINTSLSQAGMLMSMACKMMKCRELGVYEAADKVLRLPMYRMSVDVKNGSAFPPDQMQRRLKTQAQIEGLPDESEDIYCRSLRSAYYPHRPDSMKGLSMYEVLKNFNLVYGTPKKATPYSLPKYRVYFSKRKKKAVISVWKPRKTDTAEVYDRYCFQLLYLFKPWRNEDELLKDFDGNIKATYSEAYEAIHDQLKDLYTFEQSRERLQKMIVWAEEIQRNAREKAEEEALAAVNTEDTVDDQEVDEMLSCQSAAIRAKLTAESVQVACDSLNQGQRKVFDMIVQGVESLVSTTDADGRQVQRIFVSGVGGTGKSHLIRACRDYLEFHYSKEKAPAVLVAAPTGIAALNIDGVTIHRLLKLPIQKSKRGSAIYRLLKPFDAKQLRVLFRNVKLLILDEVSMLSSLNFMFIHRRLNEILIDENVNPLVRFGDINILLLGDLLQLPPVEGAFIFQKTGQYMKLQQTDTLRCDLNFWSLFTFVELTENMRQREDLQYAEMLGRIRIGSPTVEDLALLRGRAVDPKWLGTSEWSQVAEGAVQKFMSLMQYDPAILCLMPLNVSVEDFNSRVMTILNLRTFAVAAIDVHKDMCGVGSKKSGQKRRTQKPFKQKPQKKVKAADTGGLEESLTLAVGARVMLRRNSEVDSKLVNGSIGIIESVSQDRYNKPVCLKVKFDGRDEAVPIFKISVKYNVSDDLYVHRLQFPVTVAYAITIHKCQGLSLDTAMVDIGSDVFSNGMGYVALSRIRTLKNLHLIRFSPGILKADTKCIQEYNRLRRKVGIADMISNYNKNPEMEIWKPKVSVSVHDQKQQLVEEMDIHAKSKGAGLQKAASFQTHRAVRNKASAVVPPAVSVRLFLAFSNADHHSCFANAAVQCILRCFESTRPPLQQLQGSQVGEIFGRLLEQHMSQSSTSVSTDELRNSFGEQSQYATAGLNIDCDTREFLMDLIPKFPECLSQRFQFTLEETGICRNCNGVKIRTDPEPRIMLLGSMGDGESYRFKDVFSDQVRYDARCDLCQVLDHNFMFKVNILFESANKYMLLNCPVQTEQDPFPMGRLLSGLKADGSTLYGQRWSVIATVQMAAWAEEENVCRHFIAFVRTPDNVWVRLNDSSSQILKRRPPFRDMVLYVLERQLI